MAHEEAASQSGGTTTSETREADSDVGLSRRRILQGAGAATSLGLAGCSFAGGGDDDVEGGERVQVDVSYWADLGGLSRIFEGMVPTLERAFDDLGLDHSIDGYPLTQAGDHVAGDTRDINMAMWASGVNPARLDPQFYTRPFHIDHAGGNGKTGYIQYADCELSDKIIKQQTAATTEDRREIVGEIHQTLTDDIYTIPLVPRVNIGVYNPETIDIGGVGQAGLQSQNSNMPLKSKPIGKDHLTIPAIPSAPQTTNFMIHNQAPALLGWNHWVHSPLVMYDENYELTNVLADNIKQSDDGLEITIELIESTFHNGDPVTSEAVAFTLDLITNANSGFYPQAEASNIESIDTPDDRTAVLNLSDPDPVLMSNTLPSWGILHPPTWEGALDNPEDFAPDPDELVGSGPFELDNMRQGTSLTLTSYDDHPVFNPGYTLNWVVYEESQARIQALESGDLDYITSASPDIENQIGDTFEVEPQPSYMPMTIWPQTNHGPTQFREFRLAVGMAINRAEINELALDDNSKPILESTTYPESHPYHDVADWVQFTDDPTGDVEGARQVLEDAGWTWDDNGNLLYPEDVDTSPKWPAGETPDPAEYDCLGEEGEYVPSEES